jgi:hypothetical protein
MRESVAMEVVKSVCWIRDYVAASEHQAYAICSGPVRSASRRRQVGGTSFAELKVPNNQLGPEIIFYDDGDDVISLTRKRDRK